MSPEQPTILLTGATGFIGRHLAPVLAARGARVRGATRRAPAGAVPGVAEWAVIGAIGPDTDWQAALHGVTTVVHLAALAHQTDPRQQPTEDEFMGVNAAGTRRLAEAARAAGTVRRLVLISSIGAVTDMCNTLIEESALAAPMSPYGRSKLAAEQAVHAVLEGSAVEWCVLRPVLVYGPGNPGNMARLLKLVRSGLPLPLGGLANQRSFLFVGNLVDAIDRVLESPGAAGRVFLVADDEKVSTAELIRLLARAADRRARLWSAPAWGLQLAAQCGDLAEGIGLRTGLNTYSLRRLEDSLAVSNQALRLATGWRPRTTLLEGLRQTLGRTAP
jgi:nucleoside-diphosphate-sugar epimerase